MRLQIDSKYGENLQRVREILGLSQEDLAHLFGVSQQQVEKYESGRNRLRLEYVEILCKEFLLPYDVIFRDTF